MLILYHIYVTISTELLKRDSPIWNLSTLSSESLVVPSMQAEQQLTQLAEVTEGELFGDGDVFAAVTSCFRDGRTITEAVTRQMAEASAAGADAATASLGRSDRRKVNQAVREMRDAKPTAEMNDFTVGLAPGSEVRRVVGLQCAARRGFDIASRDVQSERTRRVGKMLLGLRLNADERIATQRTLLTPGILHAISQASYGLFTGGIIENQPAGMGTHFWHPLEKYPAEIASSPYLMAASKYWVLGGAAEHYTPALPDDEPWFLKFLPEAQRPNFLAAAKDIHRIQTAAFMKNFQEYRQHVSDGVHGTVVPEAVPEDSLQAIIAEVGDPKCIQTLLLIDPALVQRTVTSIRDMRSANPGITDRDVYITFMGQL